MRAKKKFGQNFLTDQSVIKKIVDNLQPKEQDKFLEIGPGMGAITKPILDKISFLNVVEIDSDMINYLKKNISQEKINVIDRDILSIPTSELKQYDRIIGNLPYYISTEILLKMISIIDSIKDLHFMFQKEVAERITAKPNNKNYGRLTILIQYFYEAEILFHISSKSFLPAPKIESSFIKLTPKIERKLKFKNLVNFEKVIKKAFQYKRKTIKNNFKNILTESNFESLNINSSSRSEMLNINDFIIIENYIYENKISI